MKKIIFLVFLLTVILVLAHNEPAVTTVGRAAIPVSAGQSCHSVNDLPDSKCTPGVARTQDLNVICHQTTGQFRPSVSYTNKLKVQQIKQYGFTDTKTADYEEDHLISLELGGDGSDPANLWPEAYPVAHQKDAVENYLHKQICSRAMTAAAAQQAISKNWKQFLPAFGTNSTSFGAAAVLGIDHDDQ